VIDDHCHPFSLEGGPLDLSLLTLDIHPDTGGRRARLEPSRVGHELLAVRLGKRLGCAPEEVPEARAEASKDWGAYVSGLFREAGLEALIMDPAYPPDAAQNLDLYRDLAGCPVHPIFRIETVIDPLMEQGASLTEIVESMEEGMRRAAGRGYVGFKTILAYRTGLAVDADVTKEAAERSLRSQVPVRRRGKAARDYLLRRALGTAADLGRAFQIHTGMGDSDIRLAEANPLLLEDLLRTPEGSAAPIVLIHGSYPWHEELAYLAWTRPNVWADLTLFNLFSTVTTADRLLRVLDLAPSRKVVVGTDAYHEPELFWFGAMVMAEAWDSVAARFEDAGARRSWIEQARDQVFEGNARELYGI
jgi:predicted TIM-barrel fold metal-dependent hydrolase